MGVSGSQVALLSILLSIDLVDLGGSLAVASRGLFATGVSTDLNGKLIPAIKSTHEAELQIDL